jgi:serine protease AprX
MTAPTAEKVWRDRALVALADLPADAPPAGPSAEAVRFDAARTEAALIEQVAVRFADRFSPGDREYALTAGHPRWHDAVRTALAALRADGLVDGGPDGSGAALTDAGRAGVPVALRAAERVRPPEPERAVPGEQPLLVPSVIAAPLRDRRARARIFRRADDAPVPVMAEINLRFAGGADAAFARLDRLWRRVTGGAGPARVAGQYATGELSMHQVERLVAADAVPVAPARRSLYRVWPDFPITLHVDASCVTVKADAARRSFNAYGDRIVWAVVDTGIDARHPHFAHYATLGEEVADLHRDFTAADPAHGSPLTDDDGHGTHVAGIIAGAVEPWVERTDGAAVRAVETRYNPANPREPMTVPRPVRDLELLAGVAPRARLVSLKAVSGGTPNDRVNRVIAALAYVREVNGEGSDGMRIHGVNLSVGYEFDPEWFACGRSPLCAEVDKLVRSGVVVVVAAGNSGYGTLDVADVAPRKFGLPMTINDPGNAERAITVGSTHRDSPHTYGVSYFSSKGPTGDGRCKPDLVAPGERITSCAAGTRLRAVTGGEDPGTTAVYVEATGTSMAAPHASGAAAALLSVRREFIGDPDKVKKILVDSATTLGRSADFQGKGLLDLMRALQSV